MRGSAVASALKRRSLLRDPGSGLVTRWPWGCVGVAYLTLASAHEVREDRLLLSFRLPQCLSHL
jgi:hypothetical protein